MSAYLDALQARVVALETGAKVIFQSVDELKDEDNPGFGSRLFQVVESGQEMQFYFDQTSVEAEDGKQCFASNKVTPGRFKRLL